MITAAIWCAWAAHFTLWISSKTNCTDLRAEERTGAITCGLALFAAILATIAVN